MKKLINFKYQAIFTLLAIVPFQVSAVPNPVSLELPLYLDIASFVWLITYPLIIIGIIGQLIKLIKFHKFETKKHILTNILLSILGIGLLIIGLVNIDDNGMMLLLIGVLIIILNSFLNKQNIKKLKSQQLSSNEKYNKHFKQDLVFNILIAVLGIINILALIVREISYN